MSKITYIGGDYIEWTGGEYTEYSNKTTISTNQKLNITADGEKFFGDKPEGPPKKEITDLKVIKIEGPFKIKERVAFIEPIYPMTFEGNTEIEKTPKLGESYIYKVTPSRKLVTGEEHFLNWAIKMNNGEIKPLLGYAFSNKLIADGSIILNIIIEEECNNAKVYAYFNESDKEKYVELKFKEQKCYCDRDFTVEEMKNIVKEIRDNTFYANKPISYHHKDKLFHQESSLPKKEKNNYEKLTEVLNKTFKEFNINTCIRKIHFLAQMYPETNFFTDLSENSPNPNLGIYYGRGFIQLTHKGDEDVRTKNAISYLGYKKYSKLDVITNPNLICESLEISSNSAGWFWRFGKRLNDGSIKDLNTLADSDDGNEISRLVNGGNNARKERLEAAKQLKKIFNYEKCTNKK
jgi:predicted chitinase